MRKEEKPEYLKELMSCIPLLRKLLEAAVAERREDRMLREEWSLHEKQYEVEWPNATYREDFRDEWQ